MLALCLGRYITSFNPMHRSTSYNYCHCGGLEKHEAKLIVIKTGMKLKLFFYPFIYTLTVRLVHSFVLKCQKTVQIHDVIYHIPQKSIQIPHLRKPKSTVVNDKQNNQLFLFKKEARVAKTSNQT